MKPYGPEHPDYPNAPSDWDGGPYQCRDGKLYHMRGYGWGHGINCWNASADWDRIAYTPQNRRDKPMTDQSRCCHCGYIGHHAYACPVVARQPSPAPVDSGERVKQAIAHAEKYGTKESDPRRKYTPAQMEIAIRHAIAALTDTGEEPSEAMLEAGHRTISALVGSDYGDGERLALVYKAMRAAQAGGGNAIS